MILGIQVIIWWAGLMRGAVSIALAYNKVKPCGLCPIYLVYAASKCMAALYSFSMFN